MHTLGPGRSAPAAGWWSDTPPEWEKYQQSPSNFSTGTLILLLLLLRVKALKSRITCIITCPETPANWTCTAEGTVCPISFVKDVLVGLSNRFLFLSSTVQIDQFHSTNLPFSILS
jgi:hypothetical protein